MRFNPIDIGKAFFEAEASKELRLQSAAKVEKGIEEASLALHQEKRAIDRSIANTRAPLSTKPQGDYDPRPQSPESPEKTEATIRAYFLNLKLAIQQYDKSHDQALIPFQEAMKLRASLLTDPTLRYEEDRKGKIRDSLVIAEDGSPRESLRLTSILHRTGQRPAPKTKDDGGSKLEPLI